jgi:predicted HicB family RNase H-like nuclease
MTSAHDTVGIEPKNLKIDPVIHRQLKVEAATRGVSLQTLTEMALMIGLSGLAHTFRYRDLTGSIGASPVDGCLHGKLLGTADLVTYEGQTVTELEAAFQRAVDQYLSDREASRQSPRGDSQ